MDDEPQAAHRDDDGTDRPGGRPDEPVRGRRRGGVVGGVIGRVVPAVIDRVDMNELLEHIDLDAVAARLDLDALVERLDVDAVAARLDLDALIGRMDVDAVAAQLDLDALVERLDVNAVAERLDLDDLMHRIDMARLTAGATQDVATSGLDLARRQLARGDATVDSITRRLLRRGTDDRPPGPPQLLPAVPDRPPAPVQDEPRRRTISGHYAGPVTRLAALAGDLFGALSLSGVLGGIVFSVFSIFGVDTTSGSPRWLALAFGALWFLAWFWLPVALFGRTAGMGLAGIAVVGRDGSIVGARKSLVRALVLPLSLVFFPIAMIGPLVGRERRTFHDVAAGTVVVYDWGGREAEQPTSVRDLLDARIKRRRSQVG